jgi:hypothetical protein
VCCGINDKGPRVGNLGNLVDGMDDGGYLRENGGNSFTVQASTNGSDGGWEWEEREALGRRAH